MTDIELLPRVDLPVIWEEFKTKANAVRRIAETLTVTSIEQKEDMAIARRVRLTLREIRIAVEHKRVELGEGHLKEIQKVNGAAKAIREFIEPLEARLLDQETFAERAEARRIAELSKSRMAELSAIRPGIFVPALASMTQAQYDEYLARLRSDVAEVEAANRLRAEAEKQLAEVRAEAQKRAIELQLELKAESDRLKAEAQATLELAQRVALDVKQRSDAEAALRLREHQEQLYAGQKARKEIEDRAAAERQEAEEKYRREQAEKDRVRDEQFAKLEAELAQERAAKQAETDAARRLAVAPDLEQLQAFSRRLQQIIRPELKTIEAEACLSEASRNLANAILTIDIFISNRS